MRIVADLPVGEVETTKAFYTSVFGLECQMDLGWFQTFSAEAQGPVQLSTGKDGGNGAPMPRVSIEVDNVDETHARAREFGAEITYALTDEPWGVRRFFVKDPSGNLLNVLQHSG